MTDMRSDMPRADRERLENLARRSPASEGMLIFGAGGSLLAVVIFAAAMPMVVRLAEALLINPSAVWLAVSFGGGGVLSLLHMWRLKPRVDTAQRASADALHAYQRRRDAETAAKLAAMATDGRENAPT